jgi:hypothetical protein
MAGSDLRFCFELAPLERVMVWGADRGERRLHWFGLTDGYYWVELNGWEFYRYDDRTLSLWAADGHNPPRPYVDYPVVRLWEDLLEIVPEVLVPVPDDLREVSRSGAFSLLGDRLDEFLDLDWKGVPDDIGVAVEWSGARTLSAGHLIAAPLFGFDHELGAQDVVRVRWVHTEAEGIGFTAPATGGVEFPFEVFIAAVTDFDSRLIGAMGARVDEVATGGLPADIQVDVDRLIAEHSERATALEGRFRSPSRYDIDRVRRGIDLLRDW